MKNKVFTILLLVGGLVGMYFSVSYFYHHLNNRKNHESDSFSSGQIRITAYPEYKIQTKDNSFVNQFALVGEGVKRVDSVMVYAPSGILLEYKVASAFKLVKKSGNSCLNVLVGANPDFSRESPVLLAEVRGQPMEDENHFFIMVRAKVNGIWLEKTLSYEW